MEYLNCSTLSDRKPSTPSPGDLHQSPEGPDMWVHHHSTSLESKIQQKTKKDSSVNHLVKKVLSQVPYLAGSKPAWEQQTILPNYQKWLSLDNGLNTHIINRINVGRILWIFTFLRSPPKRNREVPPCEQKILLTLHAVKRAQECGPLKDNCQQETEPETPPLPDEEAVCGAFW